MKKSSITLTKQQRIWLRDLIFADIQDWQSMASRPVDEIGLRFSHLADARIRDMQVLLAKLDVLDLVETLNRVHKSGLVPGIVRECDCGALLVFDEP